MADERKAPEAAEMGTPLYMLSFGDMMTNLLCFFILLCAFAHERRVGFISDGLGAFRAAILAHGLPGVLDSDTLPLDMGASRVLFRPAKSILPRLLVDKQGDMKDGNRNALRDVVTAALRRQSTTRLPLSIVFRPGSAELTRAQKSALAEIAPRLAGGNFVIRLSGYAWREGLPAQKEWALAFSRAGAVMKGMRALAPISKGRFDLRGFGPPADSSRGDEVQLTWGRRVVLISLVQGA